MKKRKKLPITGWCLLSWGVARCWGAVWWGFGEGRAGRGSILCNCFAAGFASVMELFVGKIGPDQTVHNASFVYRAQYVKFFGSVVHRAHAM